MKPIELIIPYDQAQYGSFSIAQGFHGPWSHRRHSKALDLSYAVDLKLPFGTAVNTVQAGVLVNFFDRGQWKYYGDDPNRGMHGGYTNFAVVAHDGGFCSVYSHLASGSIRSHLQRGQFLPQGTLLAHTGESGWLGSIGSHLHLQLNRYCQTAVSQIQEGIPFSFREHPSSLEHSNLFP